MTTEEQDWCLKHGDKICKIAKVVCEVNPEHRADGLIAMPCLKCVSNARVFFVDMTRKDMEAATTAVAG